MSLLLDFSIGPVQGFVAQSRRTRDLWGSSYLLSFLSAHAMWGIQEAGGRIVRPVVANDPLFAWVCAAMAGTAGPGEAPRIGSVPNHFVAELQEGADPAGVAQAGIEALERAWELVCDAVWTRFLEAAPARGLGTGEIWARQVSGFWEVAWTSGSAEAGGGLLARRKHWRSQWLPQEPGDKCTLMPDFQELSGVVRASGRAAREQQDAFWDRLRRDVGSLDLRSDERLCAIALVKRLFPKVAQAAIGWELDVSRWPSTACMAAVPWLRQVSVAAPQQAEAFAALLRTTAPREAVSVSRRAIPALAHLRSPLAGCDANYFQAAFLADPRRCPLGGDASPQHRKALIALLKELQDARAAEGGSPGAAPVFYALLLADGDRLGQLVGSLGGQAVGSALAAFTAAAPSIVEDHDGVTVYAGGDDVLAMLPVSTALACASALADCYAASFQQQTNDAQASLSAAVVFAHVRLPLGAVLSEAHRLLDDVAKARNGRNSLAVAVLKRGGCNSLWATTWRRPGACAAAASAPPLATQLLADLVGLLQQRLSQPGLSSALLYRLRDTLSLLCNWPQWEPGGWGAVPAGLDLGAFVRADLINSLMDQGLAEADARPLSQQLAGQLLPLLQPARAAGPEPAKPEPAGLEVGVDALLVARFLAAPTQEDTAA